MSNETGSIAGSIAGSIEPKTFYSSAGALIVNINTGHRITEGNGISKVVGQKIAEFMPQNDGFGKLTSRDPEVIAMLEARIAAGAGDVFDEAEYQRRITPAEIQLAMMKDERDRLVTDRNRLLAQLAERGKAPAAAARS